VKEAGLADKLGEKGEWTVFAPTDAAFKKIDKATLEKVKGDKEMLTKILTAHATKGTFLAADVVKLDGKEVETLPDEVQDRRERQDGDDRRREGDRGRPEGQQRRGPRDRHRADAGQVR
jgi:uncharacterized surface protein with fasciclin (FAS1) repeats